MSLKITITLESEVSLLQITFAFDEEKDNYFCYEMDKTSIFMFEIFEPGGSALGK